MEIANDEDEEVVGLSHHDAVVFLMKEFGGDPWRVHPDDCTDEEIDRHLSHVGSAAKLKLRERDIAKKLMYMLAIRIKRRTIAGKHLDILGRFLIDIINRRDHALALTVLGQSVQIKRGAPNDDEVRWLETRETYVETIETGETDWFALHAAWVIWTWDYELNLPKIMYRHAKKKIVKSTWSDGRPMTLYEQQVERIKARLHKEGLRKPDRRGRKPAGNSAD